MKNLVLSLVVLVTGVQANARSIQRFLSAPLTHFSFQKGSDLEQGNIHSGTVSLDLALQEITLTLNRAWYCPPGAICAMVMPAPEIITVPLTGRSRGTCGEVVYTGMKNNLPVDGHLVEVTVVDYRSNNCATFAILPATEVELHIQGGRGPAINEYHVMTSHTSLR